MEKTFHLLIGILFVYKCAQRILKLKACTNDKYLLVFIFHILQERIKLRFLLLTDNKRRVHLAKWLPGFPEVRWSGELWVRTRPCRGRKRCLYTATIKEKGVFGHYTVIPCFSGSSYNNNAGRKCIPKVSFFSINFCWIFVILENVQK